MATVPLAAFCFAGHAIWPDEQFPSPYTCHKPGNSPHLPTIFQNKRAALDAFKGNGVLLAHADEEADGV